MTESLDDLSIAEVRLPVVAARRGRRIGSSGRLCGVSACAARPSTRAYLGLIALRDTQLVRGSKPWAPANGVSMPWPALGPADRRPLIFGPDATAGSAVTFS